MISLGYQTPSDYAERKTNRFDGGCAPPNPGPLAAAGVRGELNRLGIDLEHHGASNVLRHLDAFFFARCNVCLDDRNTVRRNIA